MEVRFERLCGLEEPLLRGMRIGKSCRLGFCTTMYVQPLYVHWRDIHDVFRYGGVRVSHSWLCVNTIRCGHYRGFKHGDRGQETNEARTRVCPYGGSHDQSVRRRGKLLRSTRWFFPQPALLTS